MVSFNEVIISLLIIIFAIYGFALALQYYFSKTKDKVISIDAHMKLMFVVSVFLLSMLYAVVNYLPHKTVFIYSLIFSFILGFAFYLYWHYKHESTLSYIDKFHAPRLPFHFKKKNHSS